MRRPASPAPARRAGGLPETNRGGYQRRAKKKSTKGIRPVEESTKGVISTKGLEKAQEGSAKGREGGKDFQEGAEVSVKGVKD